MKKTLVLAALLVFCASYTFAQTPQSRMKALGLHPAASANGGFLLGGSQNGKWLSASEVSRMIEGGEMYTLYSMMASHGTVMGSIPLPNTRASQDIRFSAVPRNGSEIIALGAEWNAQISRPQRLSPRAPGYRDIVDKVLTAENASRAVPYAVSVYKIDLEGDGVFEEIITATTPNADFPQETGMQESGDYSFVVMRKQLPGELRDVLVCGEFYKKMREVTVPTRFDTVAFLDLNGDGVMEIVVKWTIKKGWGIDVYDISSGKSVLAMSEGKSIETEEDIKEEE